MQKKLYQPLKLRVYKNVSYVRKMCPNLNCMIKLIIELTTATALDPSTSAGERVV